MRHIFRRHVELGSVRVLKEELEAQAITGKIWISAPDEAGAASRSAVVRST